jgi:hypothetical protein
LNHGQSVRPGEIVAEDTLVSAEGDQGDKQTGRSPGKHEWGCPE